MLVKTLSLMGISLLGVWLVTANQKQRESLPTITTYKNPSCGCCEKWVQHMRRNGWHVDVMLTAEHFNVPQHLHSCHTSVIGNHIFEGHIPTDYIESFIAKAPTVRGLAVPGMPLESPGMETHNHKNEPRYEIYSFTDNGEVKHYATVYRRQV